MAMGWNSFKDFMELKATEKGRNQEAETREKEGFKPYFKSQDWEMEIAGEGQASQTSAPAGGAVKGLKVCEEFMTIKADFDGVLN